MSSTRRTFLKTAALAAAGTTLAGEPLAASVSSVRHPALLGRQELGDRFDPWIDRLASVCVTFACLEPV